MSAFTSVRNAILSDYFRSSATKMGTPLEIGLSTTEPAANGTNITEPIGGGYARQSVANTDSEWIISTTESFVFNTNEINFGTATANWGVITHYVIYQSGAPKFFGEITDSIGASSPKNVQSGDRFLFLSNGLRFQIV